ncbi:MAG TPA: 6-carboxytetrahydropterin synthase QueD, partial [Terriglobales bacterium]|nr:6-carboxytetrahydropterin synthase QueD [Terriglobales bacterium]
SSKPACGAVVASKSARKLMFEVSVEDTFASGHALRGYRGKCENPHGHNYKVQVTLHGERLDNIGLLFDFKDLKVAMNDIIDRLDHKFINDIAPFTDLNPSAENMAKYFYDEINVLLEDKTQGRVKVKQVKMWETDTTAATYFE